MMPNIIPRWSAVVLALLPLTAGAANEAETMTRQRQGDDLRWAARDWDDRDWQPGYTVPARTGIYWIRCHFSLTDPQLRLTPQEAQRESAGLDSTAPVDSIFLAAPYAFELYWDGRLIGRSGKVGATREAEVAGPLDNLLVIPSELLGPGEHVIAIRLSSFHYNFPAARVGFHFLLRNAAQSYASEIRRPIFPMISLGGALLVALLSGLLYWLVDRWRPLLLCSALSLALAVFYLLIAWRWIQNAPYDWFYPRLLAITWVMTLIAGLFPWLLLEQFSVPRRRWYLPGMVPLLAVGWMTSPFYEIKALWLCREMLAVSLVIAGWAVWRQRPGARFVLAGVLVGLLMVRTEGRDFLDPSFFVTFGVLVLIIFATLGVQLRADRRRTQEATLTAVRLETELLRKNLQPHFLLNTLTALSEVVEQNPPDAVRLINDLAEEFRSLSRMSGEKLIPLAQELDLCRAHLRVMSLRTETTWRLEADQVDPAAPVPPALFLTLIENGYSHQRVRTAVAAFTLRQAPMPGGGTRYVFVSPGQGQTDATRTPGGTGLRYVKARLEESFPGRWGFRNGWTDQGWESVVEIRQPA